MSELRVNPSEVHQSGVEIGEIAAAVTSAFTNSDTEFASAQSGWVGESGRALASVTAEWQEATKAHHENLVEHANKFVSAAQMYVRDDLSSADSVRKAGENLR
jgi:uncharacterized protein YukE